jgi:DNA-binding CsgD family transcriptional regulator
MIAAVRLGDSRTLVLRGEAGVGKTALTGYAEGLATDLRVLRAVAVPSETELAFAALHQLCAPVLDQLGRLPFPQCEALSIVFGLSSGPPPDQFLVGLAVLSLLREVSEHCPLLGVVDDSHWLDQASAQTLGFVARRLGAEPVGLVFATRAAREELRGLPELPLRGLDADDARGLLGSVVRFRLDERVSDRIVAESGGNPQVLLELSRGLSPAQLAGGFAMMDDQALSERPDQTLLDRLDALPDDARRLLLVAAAEPLGDPLLVWSAAQRLGIGVSAAMAAEGFLIIRERVTFRAPSVRSAVYRTASVHDRRSVHLALAQVTDARVDPDRRVWHLAAASPAPDEDVASELELSAGRAEARGGLSAAVSFLRRSVALSLDPAQRANRALAAARASLQAGSFDLALGLLATAEDSSLSEFQQVQAELVRAETAHTQSRGRDSPHRLLQAARALEALDARLAREAYLDAWSAAFFAGGSADAGGLFEVSQAARGSLGAVGSARLSDLLLDGLSLVFTDSRAAATPLLKQAATGFADNCAPGDAVRRWGWLASAAAAMVWDYETAVAVATRSVALARESGALAALALAANGLAHNLVLGGDFATAGLLIAEADAVKEVTGTRVAPYSAVILAGLAGRDTEAIRLIDTTIADGTADGQGNAVQYARWVRAIVLNSLGRYDEALVAAGDAADDTPEPPLSAWSLSELIEAAVRTEKTGVALSALSRLAESTDGSESDWATGSYARARALLSEGDEAERLYCEAIAALGRTRLRPELARAHLLYGEWLRRQSRRVDARHHLRMAHDLFALIGMEAFAERTRRELQATGGTVRKRNLGSRRDELTPQERQIALLARDGLSNPEVGARLFLSPRTVEWHLRKVFTKLAISSRKELREALRGSEYLVPS